MKQQVKRGEETAPADIGAIRQYEGNGEAGGLNIGLVVSRFNEELTRSLLQSALTCLEQRGALPDDLEVVWVPGAYEIPVVASRMAESCRYDAIIALGCVIEGETAHAELINRSVARSLTDIACLYDVPVVNEVVAARTLEQAEARCFFGQGSRGWYAAEVAVEMARLLIAMDDAWDDEIVEMEEDVPWAIDEEK